MNHTHHHLIPSFPQTVCDSCFPRVTRATVRAALVSARGSLCVAALWTPTCQCWLWSSSRRVMGLVGRSCWVFYPFLQSYMASYCIVVVFVLRHLNTFLTTLQDIPGLTDGSVPRRLGPKRASKIRKLFNLSKQDDVRQYVIKRPLAGKEGKKPKTKAPKIQRLITPVVLQVRWWWWYGARQGHQMSPHLSSLISLSLCSGK